MARIAHNRTDMAPLISLFLYLLTVPYDAGISPSGRRFERNQEMLKLILLPFYPIILGYLIVGIRFAYKRSNQILENRRLELEEKRQQSFDRMLKN